MSDQGASSEEGLGSLLEYLRDERHFDFTGYKRGSLARRIAKRMQAVGVPGYEAYHRFLEANPAEFSDLFNTILINVTDFMRDGEAWEYLGANVIPQLVARKDSFEPIRVWSAGCASGEEAYSLAVLLAEAAGEERFRRSVKIYATDADNDALVHARQGRYAEEDLLRAFGKERVERFFEVEGGSGVFRPDLRHSVIFGRHDLIQDPPISRIDLLACRNTLMYFTAEVQARILTTFHFALTAGGYLFLGKSEALVSRSRLFQPVELKYHLFLKDGDQARASFSTGSLWRPFAPLREPATRFVESAFEGSATGQLVIDDAGVLVLANRQVRATFGIGIAEVGRPFSELEVSHRPVDLRGPVEEVLHDRRPVFIGDVAWETPSGDTTFLDIQIVPTTDPAGASVTFSEVGRYRQLREQLERSQVELESAYEELQSAVEELETTNEELQSTNEELETMNEELQSTNEELEMMNEELQSTNEELETINAELRLRTAQLDEANQFLESVLGSLQSAVVVLDPDMHVKEWSRQAEELWGLRSEEVEGQHFLNLDIGLPVVHLREATRAVLAGSSAREEQVLSAVNRRGRSVECNVSVTPLLVDGQVIGAILVMDAEPGGPPT